MNRVNWACLLLGILGGASIFAEEVKFVPVCETPPVIDGVLNDSCWSSALVFDGMKVCDASGEKREKPERSSVTRLLCDEAALYVAVIINEPKPEFDTQGAQQVKRDNPWVVDYVEVFINTTNDMANYYQFSVNALGYIGDLRLIGENALTRKESFSWDALWEAKVKVDKEKNQWYVEEKIPLAILDFSLVKNGVIGINVARQSVAGSTSYSFTGYFHNPKRMENIKLGCDTSWRSISFDRLDVSSYSAGKNTVKMAVTNFGESTNFKVRVGQAKKEGTTAISYSPEKEIVLPKGEKKEVCQEFVLSGETDSRALTFRILNDKGRVVCESSKVFEMAEPIGGNLNSASYFSDEKNIRADLLLNVSPQTLGEIQLKASIQNSSGKSLWEGIEKDLKEKHTMYIPLQNPKAGKYTALFQLVDKDGNILAKRGFSFEISESPF